MVCSSNTPESLCRKLLFLHTNLSPKWNVGLSDDFDKYYTRRWEVLQPGDRDWVEFSREHFAEDLERVRALCFCGRSGSLKFARKNLFMLLM